MGVKSAEDHFVSRMKQLRAAEGLTQVDLESSVAESSGLLGDPKGLSILRLEKGRRSLRLGEALAIANALGVTLPSMLPKPDPVSRGTDRVADPMIERAADAAPRALGEFIGDGVAVVLLDHAHDEHPDPNIHELAHRVLMLARLGGGS